METQSATDVCILIDLMSMLWKVETGCVHRQLMEPVSRSRLQHVAFIFMPGHAEIKGNERSDSLTRKFTIADGRAMD